METPLSLAIQGVSGIALRPTTTVDEPQSRWPEPQRQCVECLWEWGDRSCLRCGKTSLCQECAQRCCQHAGNPHWLRGGSDWRDPDDHQEQWNRRGAGWFQHKNGAAPWPQSSGGQSSAWQETQTEGKSGSGWNRGENWSKAHIWEPVIEDGRAWESWTEVQRRLSESEPETRTGLQPSRPNPVEDFRYTTSSEQGAGHSGRNLQKPPEGKGGKMYMVWEKAVERWQVDTDVKPRSWDECW